MILKESIGVDKKIISVGRAREITPANRITIRKFDTERKGLTTYVENSAVKIL